MNLAFEPDVHVRVINKPGGARELMACFNRAMDSKGTSGTKTARTREIWLTQQANGMGLSCMIVEEDESARAHEIESLSMRGGQREVTGLLKDEGWEPVGRWTAEDEEGLETMRAFRKPGGAAGDAEKPAEARA